MIQRLLIVTIIFILSSPKVNFAGDNVFLYFSKNEIQSLKKNLKSVPPLAKPHLSALKARADSFLNMGPWSIAEFKSPSVSKNPNDYYSESPYWWPDPDNPHAPYIRHDGERNPDRFMGHKSSLQKMHQASFTLILAGYLFDEHQYILHALDILNVWFIDPNKRMNPNMDYAQAIPNKSPGRGIGIIDAHRFAKLLEAFYILDLTELWPEEHKRAIKDWFTEFLVWLTTSKNGLDEKYQGNNHTTWWCTLVAGISHFVGNSVEYQQVYEYVKKEVVLNQIKSNGSMPHEEKRTRSMSYIYFNLDAYALLFQNFSNRGLDLWIYENANKGSVSKALEYVYPYTMGHKQWLLAQITPLKSSASLFWYFAGKQIPDKRYSELFKSKINIDSREMGSSYDPFIPLVNLLAITSSNADGRE